MQAKPKTIAVFLANPISPSLKFRLNKDEDVVNYFTNSMLI